METNERVRCLIIGSGPAGYTAAVYAGRANLAPVLYEGIQPGGQLTTTTDIENFPGYPEGISGTEMMEDLKKQASRFGADIRYGTVTAVDFNKTPYQLTIDGSNKREADTIIIATGASAKYLGLPVTGTLGVLIKAKRMGIIESVKPLITELRKNGFYVSGTVERMVLEQAGE